ncbi:DUF3888 domain-containing protein [Xanthomonas indica]|uniref:DUF3888 domain-containing protein n=1 Tax=Xanthomonas indica TaxID=2912242 RepID=A0AAU8I7P9_9XANT|nr:DUF3888 domain-containing protein [Xanthomonas indica]MCI2260598.1 DUF3888 domain-containing protein [Xanthomonas indica]
MQSLQPSVTAEAPWVAFHQTLTTGMVMLFKPLRRDLTESSRRCEFCPNLLTSLKAYVLEEEGTGRTVYAGPKCAAGNIASKYTLAGIPDLTKFTLSKNDGEGRVGGNGASGISKAIDPSRHALEYLLLREGKLAKDMNLSYPVLKEYYSKSLTESLTDAEILHVNRIEAKAPEKFKLANLQKCYNYLFWIDVAIERLPNDKADFLGAIRAALLKNGSISMGQKVAVNKWLAKIPGVPQLK